LYTFLDREKTDDLAHYVNNTFAADYYASLLGSKPDKKNDGQLIYALNKQAWDVYQADPLQEFKR
jgi:hypothetical protein